MPIIRSIESDELSNPLTKSLIVISQCSVFRDKNTIRPVPGGSDPDGNPVDRHMKVRIRVPIDAFHQWAVKNVCRRRWSHPRQFSVPSLTVKSPNMMNPAQQ
jgi:hypothetical protein